MEGARPILILCPLYPPVTGGLPNHAQQFDTHMAAAGYPIVVFTPHLRPTSKQEEHHGLVTVYRFPAWEIVSNYPLPACWSPRFWRQLGTILRARPRAVVSRTRFFITTPLAYLISRYLRVPWIHIEHGAGPIHLHHPVLQVLASSIDSLFARLAFRFSSLLIANSKATADFIRSFVPGRQITTIPRGVDVPAIESIPPMPKPAALEEHVVICYTGRLIDGKGLRELIRSLATLPPVPWHCYIVGDGAEKVKLEQLATRLGLRRYITFLGDVPWVQAMGWLKMSDIAVNPSYTEGLPTAIIEAALCRKAIVATDVGGTSEITSHQTLIPPGDVPALSRALESLLTNKQLRLDLGERAYADVLSKFSWPTAVAQYQAAFSAIL